MFCQYEFLGEGIPTKKWLIPLVYPLLSAAAFLISGLAGASIDRDGTGYGGVVAILYGLIIYCGIIVPAMCLFYAKRCLQGQRFRFLFTLYPSAMIALPYVILFSMGCETIVYSGILFVWSELWSLLGLLKLKRS